MANDLGSFIAAEVTRAEVDYQGGRARALSIVGVAGGLVTLIGGFLAIAAGSQKDFLPKSDRWTVVVAVFAYVAATVAALIVNAPAKVTDAKPAALLGFAQNNWNDEGWDQQVAILLAKYLSSLCETNSKAARWLIGAIACEIAGIAATAAMVLLIVQHLE